MGLKNRQAPQPQGFPEGNYVTPKWWTPEMTGQGAAPAAPPMRGGMGNAMGSVMGQMGQAGGMQGMRNRMRVGKLRQPAAAAAPAAPPPMFNMEATGGQ